MKCLPTVRETWVQSMGKEDLLEKGMATHSSILAPTPKKGAQRNIKLLLRVNTLAMMESFIM